MEYDFILNTFEFMHSRAKVKVTVAIFRKKKSSLYALIYRPISILYHANVKYDNILHKFEFECSRAKVKVTVAIFRKTLSSV